jgi:RNA polymerase sigma-70 factor, ECF subfamily
VTVEAAACAAERVARESYGKLVARIAARTGDVAAAEDALSEAFAAALAHWPRRGIPDSPEAWLIAAARRKSIDGIRREQTARRASVELTILNEELAARKQAGGLEDARLSLLFVCAHQAIAPGVRAPLMLQTIFGLDAKEIASAFLVAPSAMGQRLVRAKAKIKQAAIPFRVPEPQEMTGRLDAVLEAIYAAFAEGWLDADGGETRRRNLATEAIWLGRLICRLLPQEAEAHGLLALMLGAEARRGARRNAQGGYVPLAEQDPTLWDDSLIAEAEAHLDRANRSGAIGRFQLEAAVQSAHLARRLTGRTDWPAILSLYEALSALTQSPVVAINRAVALAEVEGPALGLAALDTVADNAILTSYQPYWAARAMLLARLREAEKADQAYERAIGLESDPAVRDFLQARRAALTSSRP